MRECWENIYKLIREYWERAERIYLHGYWERAERKYQMLERAQRIYPMLWERAKTLRQIYVEEREGNTLGLKENSKNFKCRSKISKDRVY